MPKIRGAGAAAQQAVAGGGSLGESDLISIQIIQPTPNISPTCSLRSFSGEGPTAESLIINSSGGGSSGSGGGADGTSPPSLTFPVAPASPSTSSLKRPSAISKHDRRVSFSEDSVDQEDGSASASATAPVAGATDRSSAGSSTGGSGIGTGTALHPASPNRLHPTHGGGGGSAAGSGGTVIAVPVAGAATVVGPPGPPGSIPFMNYLQVPGQQPTLSFVVPQQLSPEAKMAQTSPQARRRRQTRLMKAGSFCSIHSEGDGDIFGPSGELLAPHTIKARKAQYQLSSSGDSSDLDPGERDALLLKEGAAASDGSGAGSEHHHHHHHSTNPKTFDPLSEYSEFQQDDCRSDISDLFGNEASPLLAKGAAGGPGAAPTQCQGQAPAQLQAQGTLSDQGSIRSLSIDQEELVLVQIETGAERATTVDLSRVTARQEKQVQKGGSVDRKDPPPINNPEYDEIMQHKIKVKEQEEEEESDSETEEEEGEGGEKAKKPAQEDDQQEPYDSSSCSISMGSDTNDQSSHQITVPVTIEHPPPEMRFATPSMTDEGSASAAAPAAPPNPAPPTAQTDSGLDTEEIVPASPQQVPPEAEAAAAAAAGDDEDDSIRMVLVRDIGVQVCGDSPNLNSTRRFPHHFQPAAAALEDGAAADKRRGKGKDKAEGRAPKAIMEESTIGPNDTFPTEILF